MADTPETTEEASPKRFSKKLIGIVLGIALVQAGGFFAVFKLAGGSPQPAHGEENPIIEEEAAEAAKRVEVSLIRGFKVPNNKTGRIVIYDIDLSVVVSQSDQERMEELTEAHAGEIKDRVARTIRAASDQMLQEDDLRILRSQLSEQLVEIVGDKELIARVLIPRFVPLPS